MAANVTDRATTGEVAVVVRRRSTAKRRHVHEVLIERGIFHVETDDSSDRLATAMMNHKRTAGGHH